MTDAEIIEALKEMKKEYIHRRPVMVEALNITIARIKNGMAHGLAIEPPTEDELKELVKTNTNIELAEKYFVSLQTIYLWKRKYGLINKTSFRKRISDKEFTKGYTSPTTLGTLSKKWDVSVNTIRQRGIELDLKKGKKVK